MSRCYISLSIVILIFFTACTKENTEEKIYFIKQVQEKLKTVDKVETDFTDLVTFEWDEVCFTDGSSISLKFKYLKTNTKHIIQLPKSYHIEEDYIKGSPIQAHYQNSKLSKKNCWEKGTTFIIKKWNTNTKNDLLIQIKGA